MSPEIQQDAVEDLLAEIRILSRLNHPRLVPLVGACLEESQVIALVTELAAGGNLHHALHVRRVDFTRAQHFQISMEFLEGVRYLHSLQPPVLHLDLKSMNLVLDSEFQHVKICDLVAASLRLGLLAPIHALSISFARLQPPVRTILISASRIFPLCL